MNLHYKKTAYVIICFGAILRLVQYLFNKSLWLDEAFISLNILNRSYIELLEALDFNQGAPAGFLILTKLLTQIFGDSEYVLRCLPISCSLISLILFYKLAKHCLEPKETLIVLSLFSVIDPLIYYSSEVKQYSCDVAITLLLYLLALYLLNKNELTFKQSIISGIIGAISIWFSHPAIFVLLGTGITLIMLCINKKLWKKIDKLFISIALWILSFIILYYANLSKLNTNAIEYFGIDSFMPTPLNISWIYYKLRDVFYFIQLAHYGLPQALFIVGAIYLFLKKRYLFYILISPIPIALLVSSLHKYPFTHRLLLFLTPLYLICMGGGIGYVINWISRFFPVLQVILIGILLFHPLEAAINHLKTPYTFQEIKPVIQHIEKNKQEDDIVYIYHSAQYAFKYYAKRFGFNNDFIVDPSEHWSNPISNRVYKKSNYNTIVLGVISRGNNSGYIEDLNKLKDNKRVWLLFSHFNVNGSNELPVFLKHLDSIGTKIDSLDMPGAYGGSAVYLYDLSRETKLQ